MKTSVREPFPGSPGDMEPEGLHLSPVSARAGLMGMARANGQGGLRAGKGIHGHGHLLQSENEWQKRLYYFL